MSIQAINWSLSANADGPGQKLVLIILANYADEKGEAWPSQKTIAAQACMTDRAVRSNLAKLEAAGLIGRTHRYRKDGTFASDAYRLHLDRKPATEATPAEDSSYGPAEEISAGIQRKILPVPAEDSSYHEPSLEPPVRVSSHARARERPAPIHADAFGEFWTAYPKKRAKADARKAWQALKVKPDLFADIMAGLERAKASWEWQKDGGQFVPHPATWLRRGCWEDEFEGGPEGVATTTPGHVSSTRRHTAHGGKHEAHQRRYQSALDRNTEGQRQRAERLRRQQDAGRSAEVIEGIFTRVQGGGG